MLRRAIPFLIVVLLAGLATFAQLKYIGHSRQIAASPVLLSAFTATLRKLAVSAIVTLPLLAGLAIMLRNSWRNLPHQTLFLLGGAFASAVMHAVLFIPYWDNEYKLIFVVAMCLAVFPALALERAWSILPKSAAAIAFALAGALLFGPYLHRYASGRNPAVGPLEANGFYLQLQPQHPWSAICRAVRTMTPPESLLVVQNNEVYYPAMTSRSLYVPSSDRFYPGVTVGTDVLLAEVRANGYPILAQRRRVLNGLFDSPSTAVKEDSLHQLFRLNRPIAVVLEPRHAALLEWLRKSGLGSQVYQHEGVTLWLIRPPYRLDTHEETALGVASGNVDGTPLWNPRICCRNSRPNAPVGSA
jgi:hypothetical protein